jgi:hypothetical protein
MRHREGIAIAALIAGKPSVMKKKKPIPWAEDGIGKIYLLSVDGNTEEIRPLSKWEVEYDIPAAKNMTMANATIYDSCTDRMSTCSIYIAKKGLYFKKQGTTYWLDQFKI